MSENYQTLTSIKNEQEVMALLNYYHKERKRNKDELHRLREALKSLPR